jgi:Tol biopolymer transport system component
MRVRQLATSSSTWLFTLALVASQAGAQTPPSPPGEEELVYEIPAGHTLVQETVAISADGMRFAYAAKAKGRSVLFLDGEEQAQADEVSHVTLSADGKRLAYQAHRGGVAKLVIDGAEQPAYNWSGHVVFSPDGKHFAYPCGRGGEGAGRDMIVVDGKEGSEYVSTTVPVFSPDGRRVAHGAEKGGKSFAVVDGVEGPAFDSVWLPVFSPDGAHVAYRAKKGEKQEVMVLDGQPGSVFEEIRTNPVFAPDGRLAYAAQLDGKTDVLYLDGKEVGRFEHHSDGPVFSSGGRMAYAAWALGPGHKIAVTVDGQVAAEVKWRRGKVTDVDGLVWSPDGKRLAFLQVHGGVRFLDAAREGTEYRAKRTLFVDGVPGTEYNVPALDNVRFSEDGAHVAYEVYDSDPGSSFVVLDGREGQRFDQILRGSTVFRSGTLTYLGRRSGKVYRVTVPLP